MTVVLRNPVARVRGKLYGLKLRARALGGHYRCSVCERRVHRFDPLPPRFVEDARRHGFKYDITETETCNAEAYVCPLCGATDRERLYALYLREHFAQTHEQTPLRVLDFAPAAALSHFIRAALKRTGRAFFYRTADLVREDVDDQVDITDMPAYADGSFDFFLCSHVLEHVADDRRALRELHRILRRGGRGILVVPLVLTLDEIDEDPSVTDPAERCRRFGQDDHVRLYSKPGFLMRVRAAGFRIHELGREHFGAQAFAHHGIAERSVLYVVEKP